MTKLYHHPQWKDTGDSKETVDGEPALVTKLEIGDTSTHITKDGDGNMVFTDAATGELTLAELEGGGGGGVDTSGTPVDNDYAKFTDADTIEGRSYTEVKQDLSLEDSDINALITATKLDDLTAPDDTEDLDATDALHGLMSKADKGKLDAIEAGADQTDAANVAAAGAVMADGSVPVTAYVDITEAAEPDAPAANNLRLFTVDENGFSVLSYKDAGGMVRKFVKDAVFIAYNDSGDTIAAPRAVYASGSTGTVPTIALAKADSSDTMPAIGVTLESIANGAYGRVMQVGLLEDVNTLAFTTGDILYVSAATAGMPTATPPTYPNIRQELGTVLVDSETVGSIQIVARTAFDDSLVLVEGTAILSTGEEGASKFLREDGDGTCSWQTPAGSGDVTAAAVMTDNTIIKGDGGAKGVQDTGITVDDSDNVSGMGTLSCGTITTSGTVDGIDIAAHDTATTGVHGAGEETLLNTGDVGTMAAETATDYLLIANLENPPTEDEATKAPTSEWAYDHAALTEAHGATGAAVGTTNEQTLTNKTILATTNVVEEITTVASSATPAPTGGSLRNFYTITALAAAAEFAAPSGTPANANKLIIRIKDNGTARALTWNAIYRAMEFALPTTTVISKTMYLGFIYNSADSKWDMVSIDDSLVLENPPTEDEAHKAPTSEWAFDHDAATTGVHGAGANTILHSGSTDVIGGAQLTQVFGATAGALYNFVMTPISGEILRTLHGGAGVFTGKINSGGSGGLTVTNVPYDNHGTTDNMFEELAAYDGSSYWGQIVLHNTTRGNSRKIVSVDIGNDVITTTSSTDNWADDDDITIDSQTNVGDGGSMHFFDVDISDFVPTTTYAIYAAVAFQDNEGNADASRTIYFHPYEAYSAGKRQYICAAEANGKNTMSFLLKVVSQKITIAFYIGIVDIAFIMNVVGYLEYADT